MMLEGLLTERATGGQPSNPFYQALRREFMSDHDLKDLLPPFVRTYRSLDAFWPFIQKQSESYAGRREIIGRAFTPLLDHLEGRNRAPSDQDASEVLERFDAEGVHAVWTKALSRRTSDPEGAITMARTLLETVCKRILDESGKTYTDKEDMPKLYAMVAQELKLAPSQHTEEPIKATLGQRDRVGERDRNASKPLLRQPRTRRKKKPVRPHPRHASLAVNTAGAIATFLVETFSERNGNP